MGETKRSCNYYGVANGRIPGIYTTWSGCSEQVDKFSAQCYAGFDTLEECIDFMKARDQHNEESIYVFGPRGGRYSLQEWIRKYGIDRPDKDTMSDMSMCDIPLMVNLPDINNASEGDVRPTVRPTDDIIMQPLLAYIHYALQSGTAENIKRVVTGHFTGETIMEAKEVLFDRCDNTVIGNIKLRREGDTRSRAEINFSDIMTAMVKLDKSDTMPIFVVPSYQLHAIPRSCPEEVNFISIIDRLSQLESKWKECQEQVINTLCQNNDMKERIDKLERSSRPTYSSVTSGTSVQPMTSRGQGPQQSRGVSTRRSDQHITAQHLNDNNRKDPPNNRSALSKNGDNFNTGQTISVPELSVRNAVSMDNIDAISERSDASAVSGYQYQRHYVKKLQ